MVFSKSLEAHSKPQQILSNSDYTLLDSLLFISQWLLAVLSLLVSQTGWFMNHLFLIPVRFFTGVIIEVTLLSFSSLLWVFTRVSSWSSFATSSKVSEQHLTSSTTQSSVSFSLPSVVSSLLFFGKLLQSKIPGEGSWLFSRISF